MTIFEISLNTDTIYHERDVYNTLDFIGDVGGLKEGLVQLSSFFLFILSFFINNPMTRFLVNNVYIGSDQTETDPGTKSAICTMCQSKKQRIFYEKGEAKIEKALEIEEFLIRQQVMWSFLKSQFSKADFKTQVREKYLRINVNKASDSKKDSDETPRDGKSSPPENMVQQVEMKDVRIIPVDNEVATDIDYRGKNKPKRSRFVMQEVGDTNDKGTEREEFVQNDRYGAYENLSKVNSSDQELVRSPRLTQVD